MKGVQCYELFGGIALKNHAFLGGCLYGIVRHDICMVLTDIMFVWYCQA